MSKALKNVIVKLIVGAGQAAPSPPVGPALGSKGIKAIDFCKEFNARTASYQPGTPIPVLITIKPDRTFQFEMKSPPTGFLLLKALGLEKGHGQPNINSPDAVSYTHLDVYKRQGAFIPRYTTSLLPNQ